MCTNRIECDQLLKTKRCINMEIHLVCSEGFFCTAGILCIFPSPLSPQAYRESLYMRDATYVSMLCISVI
jgi:hypothetical protein